MPPRFTYWTIIAGGQPTAFRAATHDELLPTLKQLQSKQPDAVLMWFARGKLWPSEEAAAMALRMEREGRRDRRGADWRPGGEHKDPRDRFKVPRDVKRQQFASRARRDRIEEQGGGEHGHRPTRPAGERPTRPAGDRPFRPKGDRPFRPREDRPFKPEGDRPFRAKGDRPFKPEGDRPFRPKGDRPFKPAGDRPPGARPFRPKGAAGGDRPFRPQGPRGPAGSGGGFRGGSSGGRAPGSSPRGGDFRGGGKKGGGGNRGGGRGPR